MNGMFLKTKRRLDFLSLSLSLSFFTSAFYQDDVFDEEEEEKKEDSRFFLLLLFTHTTHVFLSFPFPSSTHTSIPLYSVLFFTKANEEEQEEEKKTSSKLTTTNTLGRAIIDGPSDLSVLLQTILTI